MLLSCDEYHDPGSTGEGVKQAVPGRNSKDYEGCCLWLCKLYPRAEEESGSTRCRRRGRLASQSLVDPRIPPLEKASRCCQQAQPQRYAPPVSSRQDSGLPAVTGILDTIHVVVTHVMFLVASAREATLAML